MKKTILMIGCICLFLTGCTSKEQDQKIKSFWTQQGMNVFMKVMFSGKGMPMPGKAAPTVQWSMTPEPGPMPVSDANAFVPTPVQVGNTQTQPQPTRPGQRPAAAKTKSVQVIEVTMDDEALPGKAPYQERVQMKKAWTKLQENNQATLQDLRDTFGNAVKDKAFHIMLNTERKLKKEAATAATYKAYAARQKQLVAEQDQAIAQLMQQNKSSIRRIKQ